MIQYMETYPRLKFKISEERDIQTFWTFIDEAEFSSGQTLKWAITEPYPFFKKYWKGNTLVVEKGVVKDFVARKYSEQIDKMRSSLGKTESAWECVKGEYFNLVTCVFEDRKWPDGKYFVYPTIWGMYPRFLEDKTFQIPFKGKSETFVMMAIAHEMLHFMFYDYLFSKRSELNTEENQMLVWHTSEIFNVVVQNSQSWISVFSDKTPGYPEHKDIVEYISRKYPEITSESVDKAIEMILEKVSKSLL